MKDDLRYGKYEMVMINGRKYLKKNFDFFDPAGFQATVENKVNRMTFDPAFFADMIDFESGRYDTRSRRRSARNSSSS